MVRVGLAAVAAAALAAGFLLFLALRPAEPATVRPIDIPSEGGDEGLRIEIRSPEGEAAPVSPLPPPRADDDSDDDDESGSGRSDDEGSDQDDGGSDDDGDGGDDGADEEGDDQEDG